MFPQELYHSLPSRVFDLCMKFEPQLESEENDESIMRYVRKKGVLEVGIYDLDEGHDFRSKGGDTFRINVLINPHVYLENKFTDVSIAPAFGQSHLYQIRSRHFTTLSTSKKPCDSSKHPVTYFVDWNNNRTQTFATNEADDCKVEMIQQALLRHCGCVDIQLYVPVALKDAPLCHEVDSFLLNYDSLEDGIMWYGNNSYNYTEQVNLLMQVPGQRMQCHQNILSNATLISQECPVLCEQEVSRFSRGSLLPFSRVQMETSTASFLRFFPWQTEGYMGNGDVMLTLKLMEDGNDLREQLAYPLQRFVADVAEIVDLWLGLSVVVLLRSFVTLVGQFCRRYQRK